MNALTTGYVLVVPRVMLLVYAMSEFASLQFSIRCSACLPHECTCEYSCVQLTGHATRMTILLLPAEVQQYTCEGYSCCQLE